MIAKSIKNVIIALSIIFSLILVVFVVEYVTGVNTNIEDIMSEILEKYGTIRDFSGTMIIKTDFKGTEEINKINFVMKMPDMYKSEDKNRSKLTVSNGKTIWIYDKKKKEVIKMGVLENTEKPEFDYGQILKDLENKENNVKLLKEEKVSDKSCYVIEVMPTDKTYFVKKKLWIDKKSWLPLKIEINYGGFNSTIEYSNLTLNTGINANEFEFTLPEGVKVVKHNATIIPKKKSINEVQKEVSFEIIEPSYTAGYEFDGAEVFGFGNVKSVSLYYTNERQDIITIIETVKPKEIQPLPKAEKVKIGEKEGEITEIAGGRLLRFYSDKIVIAVVGNIDEEELIKIAESIG